MRIVIAVGELKAAQDFPAWIYGEGNKLENETEKGRLFQPAFTTSKFYNYFLAGGAMASFVAFATRNFTTVLALIWMGSPVCGLRPMRALR